MVASNIDIKKAAPDLSELLDRASTSKEIITLTGEGEKQAVLLSTEAFEYLIGLKTSRNKDLMDPDEFEQQFHQALVDAGYDTREKIVDLVQDVKKEMYEERIQRRQNSSKSH